MQFLIVVSPLISIVISDLDDIRWTCWRNFYEFYKVWGKSREKFSYFTSEADKEWSGFVYPSQGYLSWHCFYCLGHNSVSGSRDFEVTSVSNSLFTYLVRNLEFSNLPFQLRIDWNKLRIFDTRVCDINSLSAFASEKFTVIRAFIW